MLHQEILLNHKISSLGEVFGIFSTTGKILFKSQSFQTIFGYDIKSIIHTDCMVLVHPEDKEYVSSILKKVLEKPGKLYKNIARIQHKDGHYLSCEVEIVYLKTEMVNGIIVHYRDILIANQYVDRIDYLSNHDLLTQLPNRRKFHSHLSTQLLDFEIGSKLALFIIDIDGFKELNEAFGNLAGDLVLIEVASRLKDVLFESEFIARIGSDEFGVISSGVTNIDELEKRIEYMINCLTNPILIDKIEISITVGVGVALFPLHSVIQDDLIRFAEKALNQAKMDSFNRIIFYQSNTEEEAMQRFIIKNELAQVLDRKEMYLMYQPKYHLASGKISGLEALIRWRHPSIGEISPGEFIPIAEASGQIIPVGNWILEQAIKEIKKLQMLGLQTRIAVNISPVQLEQLHFVTIVENLLEHYKIPANLLEIEITESAIMKNIKRNQRTLEHLKKLGIHISIDDFGVGYSSFNYLINLPIDTIKIDRSFVQNLSFDRDNQAIVKAIITLAQSLQLHVIAEGVETTEQNSFLLLNGCDEVQGYFYNRPTTLQHIIELLTS